MILARISEAHDSIDLPTIKQNPRNTALYLKVYRRNQEIHPKIAIICPLYSDELRVKEKSTKLYSSMGMIIHSISIVYLFSVQAKSVRFCYIYCKICIHAHYAIISIRYIHSKQSNSMTQCKIAVFHWNHIESRIISHRIQIWQISF